MASHTLLLCCSSSSNLITASETHSKSKLISIIRCTKVQRGRRTITPRALKSTGLSFNFNSKKCDTCGGQGAIECPGCKGTGRNKKNGNIFERWKCYDCQGFGLKSCPSCGKGGLTPEQRGER